MSTQNQAPVNFSDDAKIRVTKALKRIVKQLTPAELASYGDNPYEETGYVKALLKFLQQKPYMLAGERFEDGKSTSPRIFVDQSLAPQNIKFIKDTVSGFVHELRFKQGAYSCLTTRILPTGAPQFLNWRTTDCVFAAMLYLIGFRFTGSGSNIESIEKELTLELSTALEIPGKLVQDQVLLILMEDRLGWERLKVDNRNQLDGLVATIPQGTMLVVTYCSNVTTDAWHTVLARRGANAWEPIDRQSVRTTGQTASLGNGECNAWRVNIDSTLFQQVHTRMREFAGKNEKYNKYLTA